MDTGMGPRKHVLDDHIGANWLIGLNRPGAAAMRPFQRWNLVSWLRVTGFALVMLGHGSVRLGV